MKIRSQGFTMIELIVVIVILGVLAATALPKFIDLNTEAKAAALKGVVGAAGSAMTINYSGCAVTGHTVTTGKCVGVANCTDVQYVLQGGVPSGYTVTAANLVGDGTPGKPRNGNEVPCTITQDAGGLTGTFIGVSAAN